MNAFLGRLVGPMCIAVIAGFMGMVLVLTHGLSPTWLALCAAGAMTGAVIAWSGEPTETLLYGLVITAPIGITKSILARGGVYRPGLELSLVDVFLGFLLLVWAVDVVMHRKRIQMPPPGVGVVIAIFGWAWVSALTADDRIAGVLAALNQTKFLAEFVVLYNIVTTPRVLRRVLLAAGVGLTLNLLMAAAQTAAGSPLAVQGIKASSAASVELVYAAADGMRAFRPSAFVLHPNAFADYLVIVLPVPILLVMLGRARVGAAWWWGSLGLATGGALALLVTLSRGGWISLATAMTFALFVAVRRGLVPSHRAATAATLATLGVALAILAYPAVIYRVTQSDNRSTETRLVMMDQAALIIRDNVWLGVGLANYTRASQRYTPASFAPLSPTYQNLIRAGVVHNGYLLLWAERGIIGLLLHLSVFATALFRFHRVREWRDPMMHVVAVALLAGVVGQGTFYLFDHFWLDLRPGVFWLLLGLVAAVLKIQTHQSQLAGRMVRADAVAA